MSLAMFRSLRSSLQTRAAMRAFSTTPSRSADLSKLILIGRLGKEPEVRTTHNQKEYVAYTVATTNFPPPPPNPDGSRNTPRTSWHQILCFNPAAFNYLQTLQKGTQVYVEANYELREADPTAEADSPQSHKQIFLRHENIRVLRAPRQVSENSESNDASEES